MTGMSGLMTLARRTWTWIEKTYFKEDGAVISGRLIITKLVAAVKSESIRIHI
jgi:hypothetical protein